ncbi:hypothetical protein HPB50_018257 [Hyalomma asiaticum]|uniref:Uncharacterized protein n=1 Tax=Hyalomma asiaticum TaxID=266040 RepID=A0ACB7SFY9_HYAAI|nr:hypothetical protein HPB50_018257 [Hyalomma asiaticum]
MGSGLSSSSWSSLYEARSVRLNVELDHAKRAKWSPDNRALVLCTALANRVHVYRVKRREDGSPGSAEPLLQFRDAHRSSEIINVGIACNGNFIMSISMDTTLCVWSLKGNSMRCKLRIYRAIMLRVSGFSFLYYTAIGSRDLSDLESGRTREP